MGESGYASHEPERSTGPEETDLWEAIQEAKDDKFVRPEQPFEF